MKIGAHISTSGGVLNVFPRAKELGVNCFQIFASSPRQWKVIPADENIASKFREELIGNNFLPSFIHIKYLVNIGSFDSEIYSKSVQCIKEELRVASQLGLTGGMFHIGAPKAGVRSESVKLVVEGCIISGLPKPELGVKA